MYKRQGVTINGATRWLAIPGTGFTVQPADFARLALIANLAAMLAKRQRVEYSWQVFGKMILWVGIICFVIALTSTSTAVLLGLSCFLMFYIGRVPGKYLMAMIAVSYTHLDVYKRQVVNSSKRLYEVLFPNSHLER